MKDEEYLFYQDLREKKTTGYSARKMRTHCGKGGRVKFPSDYLTKKEIKNMSGECKSYRLNEPMRYDEFKAMPDDLKIAYILAIREKYKAPNVAIAKMMGTTKDAIYLVTKKLGIVNDTRGNKKWDKDGFMQWCYGVPADKEEEPAAEEATVEEVVVPEVPCETVEEEIPAIEEKDTIVLPKMVVPTSGTMNFEGDTYDILKTIGVLLGGANVKMCVSWEVCDG